MGTPAKPSRPPVVAVRSPTLVAGPEPVGPQPLPRDPFPPQFLEAGETVLASIAPKLRAYVGLPALGVAAISLLLLAISGWLAEMGDASASAVFAVFLATFLVNNLLWVRKLGQGVLVLLPLAFFLGLIVAAFSGPIVSNGAPATPCVSGACGNQTIAPALVVAELVLFAVLEIVLPLPLSLIAWYRTSYAVTDRRVVEVHGVFSRDSRWVPLERIGPVLSHQSSAGRRLGYGRIRFVDTHPPIEPTRRLFRPRFGHGTIGAEFYGIEAPEELAGHLESIIGPARRPKPVEGASATAPTATASAPPTTPASGGAAAPAVPAGARCPRCGTALVYVAPASRFYCPVCARYT